MAIKLGDAVLYLTSDSKGLEQGLGQAKRAVGGLGSMMQGALVGVGLGAFNALAGAAMGAVRELGSAVAAGSSMAETVSKVNTLFGASAAPLLTWADNAAVSMGLSKQAALDAAGAMGNMFLQLGATTDEASSTAQGMIQLSADLASFHNVAGGASEVLDSMQAAFRGEYDSLQRYIPTINAAAVEQEALAMTGKASAKELTALEKATAAQAIIMRDAGAATGDFARTSDGLANQQRILASQWENMKATIGAALLPVLTVFMQRINELVQRVLPPLQAWIVETAIPAMQRFGEIVGAVIARVLEIWGRLSDYVRGPATDAMESQRAFIARIMPIIQEIVQKVLGAIQAFWEAWGDDILRVVTGIWTVLQGIFEFYQTAIQGLVETFLLILNGDFEDAGRVLGETAGRLWTMIQDAFTAGWARLRTWWTGIDWAQLGADIINGIINGITSGLSRIYEVMTDFANGIREGWESFWQISSPSRVAARELGAPIVAGIMRGLEDEAARMRINLGTLIPGLNPLQGAAVAAPAAAGPISIVINVAGDQGAGPAARDGLLSALRQIGLA